ncbi:hypothetical protein KQX54_005630 [Cotesia glomerata]|uniref:Uncharacterized protein n=1 Tax=Cotesia glomerata TaxID=32391 RepID=A0AAV7J4H5_COTGL|nr:hypothetical protein KQX54_005630 [Cotesia glomerata]
MSTTNEIKLERDKSLKKVGVGASRSRSFGFPSPSSIHRLKLVLDFLFCPTHNSALQNPRKRRSLSFYDASAAYLFPGWSLFGRDTAKRDHWLRFPFWIQLELRPRA